MFDNETEGEKPKPWFGLTWQMITKARRDGLITHIDPITYNKFDEQARTAYEKYTKPPETSEGDSTSEKTK